LSQLQQASFQLVVCFRLGFGLDQNYEKAIEAVQQSGRSEPDLNLEIEQISSTHDTIKNELFRNLNSGGLDTAQNTIFNTANYNLVNAQLELQKDLAAINSILYNAFTLLTTIKDSLAAIFTQRGLWQDAEELDVQVVEMRKRVLGAKHPNTLISIANLASTYRSQGRWKEAEKLKMQVMKTRKRVLGAKHPSTLTSIANLASTFWDQGRWKEAEKLNVQVMKTSLRVLGAEHPDTLISIANLAHTYYAQRHKSKAIRLMSDVVRCRIKRIGADHPDTIDAGDTLREWNIN
jgi:tetratricopeptide (TPR) repeat protein